MKCELCKHSVKETFLKKVIGSYVKDSKGKRKLVCNECQKQHSMKEIKEKL